jgi:hypothetical protein
MANRIWMEFDRSIGDDPEDFLWTHDGRVYFPYYMDYMELGQRATDYLHGNVGTLEEQLEVAVRPNLARDELIRIIEEDLDDWEPIT